MREQFLNVMPTEQKYAAAFLKGSFEGLGTRKARPVRCSLVSRDTAEMGGIKRNKFWTDDVVS
ncbi:hypothetical protein BSN85_16330 [Bradyrhizobium brasilense]|nr:hypothetical protein BSN85_16330 [Bradyrhizobium brasilense]